MKAPTKRQQEILDYIRSYWIQHQFSPSFREIGSHFGFTSLGSVYNHIQSLKRKGALHQDKGAFRSLSIPSNSSDLIALPLLGALCEGRAVEMFAENETIPLPAHLVRVPDQSVLLKIKDGSLKDEQMLQGDLVVVETEARPKPGDLVIISVNEQEVLVKKYFPDPPYVRLESHNAEITPIILREEHVALFGVIRALIRDFYSS